MKKKMISVLLALTVAVSGVTGASAVCGAEEQSSLFSDGQAVFTDGEAEAAEEIEESEETEAAEFGADEEAVFQEAEEVPNLSDEEIEEAGVALFGDANTNIMAAEPIGVNTVYTDNLKDNRDVNWYKFTLPENGYISMDFEHPYIDTNSNYWKVHFLTENQKELLGLGMNGKNTSYRSMNIGLAAGTYYVKIEDDYYSADAYTFRVNFTPSGSWETEFNNDSLSADFINVNETRHGSLSSGDKDWYQFEIPKNGYVSISFGHEYLENTATWKLYIYNEKREKLAEWASYRDNTSITTSQVGLKAGKYYMVVEPYILSSKDYNFKVNYTASDAWETEFNESYSTANDLKVNTYKYGTRRADNDADWFKLTVPKDGYISMNMSHTYLDDSGLYAGVYMYHSDMQELASYSIGWRDSSFTGANIGVPAGTYYVKVSPRSYDTPYKFKINYQASNVWEKEFNDAFTDADTLKLNATKNGASRHGSDVDWYKFSVPSKRSIYLNIRHGYKDAYGSPWSVSVLNKNMKEIASFSVENKTTSTMQNLGKLAAGTYYVKVMANSWTYSGQNYTINVGTHTHTYKTYTTKATLTKDGKTYRKCSCGDILTSSVIAYPKTISLSATTFTYNGKVKTPKVTVKGSNGKTISASNYDVTYSAGRKNPGTYKVYIKFKGNYSGTAKKSFKIVK